MNVVATPRCPACDFTVFNRRYAKCESCGVELPPSLVYTAEERRSLFEAEALEKKPRADDGGSSAGTMLAASAGEAAAMAAAYALAGLLGGNS